MSREYALNTTGMSETAIVAARARIEAEREHCLVHTPSCVRGDDGLWHEPGCPAVADDESDEVLADCGECACGAVR